MRKKDSLFVEFDYYSDDELALCVMRKDNNTNNNINLLSIFKGKEALKLYKQLTGEEINNNVKDIKLTREKSEELLENLSNPSSDTIEKREKILSDISQFKWEIESPNSFSVDIPTLDLKINNEIEKENENE